MRVLVTGARGFVGAAIEAVSAYRAAHGDLPVTAGLAARGRARG